MRYSAEGGVTRGLEGAGGIPGGMEPYCMETKYCDVGHPRIQRLARHLVCGIDDDKARAVAIYRWVQDSIHYRILHHWSKRASETLVEGAGTCTNKTNLYIALLRAVGIPAGYHVMRVRGKRYFGPMWIPMLQRLCGELSVHMHPAVYLGNRWLECELSMDWALSDGTAHLNPPSRRMSFDGERDGGSNIDPANVVAISECLPNIDSLIAKRTRKPKIYFEIMNHFLEFGRQMGRTCATCDVLEPRFREWLVLNHPQTYAIFLELEAELLMDDAPACAPRIQCGAALSAY